MKTFYTFIIFLFFVLACFSQTPQISGFVCLDTCPDSKMVGTEIKYKKSFPARVQDNGRFELGLPPKTVFPIGLTVNPPEKYRNYMVINTFEVDNVNENVPVKIKMCKKEDLIPSRANYYKVNINWLMKQKYDEIEELKKQHEIEKVNTEEYKLKLTALEKKYADLEKYAKETAEKLSIAEIENQMLRNNPDYLTDVIIEKNNNRENIQQKSAKKGDIETVTENYITKEEKDNHIIRGKIIKNAILSDIRYQRLFGQYDLAIDNYSYILENRLETDDKYIFLYNYEVAELCYLINDFQKANFYINAALNLQYSVNAKYLVKTYNLSGQIKNNYREYQQAIKIYERLKKETLDDSEVCKEAAKSYMLLAGYYGDMKKNENAKTNYLKAHNIYISLNNEGEIDKDYQRLCLLYLAYLYQQEGQKALSKQCTDKVEALEQYFSISDSIQSDIDVSIKWAMADLNLENMEFNEAIAGYKQVLNYYKEQNEKYSINEMEIIKSYFTLGMVYLYKQKYTKIPKAERKEYVDTNSKVARDYFSEALRLVVPDSLKADSLKIDDADYRGLKIMLTAAIGATYNYNKTDRKIAQEYFEKAHEDKEKYDGYGWVWAIKERKPVNIPISVTFFENNLSDRKRALIFCNNIGFSVATNSLMLLFTFLL